MKAIMVMYDSLNRHYLPNYGCDLTQMPNFKRLGERTVTFDHAYAGSLPCMPARREMHTGRLNFLHRSWSPIEPFDDSMPELLNQNGVYTHLVSDHKHYWEDGGATYHTRYSSWEIIRGQEGDNWKADLGEADNLAVFGPNHDNQKPIHKHDWINRRRFIKEEDFPQAQTFANGIEFIEQNHNHDDWFLQIEAFDPHEPFFSPKEYQELYLNEGESLTPYDWPSYTKVTESDEFVSQIQLKYKALLTMCDHYLGKVLDIMDRYDLWKDTMLIVNTDHGFLLGEHGWWAKNNMPMYEEISHIPFFIWDPRSGVSNERRNALVQTIDIAPTLLDYFGVAIPKDMLGLSLKDVIASDKIAHNHVLFGIHGNQINITDGRYVYMRNPVNIGKQTIYDYTLMPTHMVGRMTPEELSSAKLHKPFSFTKGCPVLAIPVNSGWGNPNKNYPEEHLLFDLDNDPKQLHPITNKEKEAEFVTAMKDLMKENDSPVELYEYMGI